LAGAFENLCHSRRNAERLLKSAASMCDTRLKTFGEALLT